MEVTRVYVKTRAEFGKQCIFDSHGPHLDEEIRPDPTKMEDYIPVTPCHVGVQHSKQLALHECQTAGLISRGSGMFHTEGGWPREINPRDEEATARYRRRIEKDDQWAPKLRHLFKEMEYNVLQNGAVDIYEHYFEDMVPTQMVQPLGLRVANVYTDPETPGRPVTDISWSPDSGSRIAVSCCFLEFGRPPDYSNTVYIWQVENSNAPVQSLSAFCPTVATQFNPRDPAILASGLMSGQVCCWDCRASPRPVQISHPRFSHREYANAVNWLSTKNNTEFYSTSLDGQVMWWDTRDLRRPTEVLTFDLETPNQPRLERAIGVTCMDSSPSHGTKFLFGTANGYLVSGSRKAKTNAEKLGIRFDAHDGPVLSVDRNVSNPTILLSVGDWAAGVWAEDTREGCLVSTRFLPEVPTGGCWSKSRHSVFYVITGSGVLMAWDLLRGLEDPIMTIRLGNYRLTRISTEEDGNLLAVGNHAGKVYLVESTDALRSFDRKDRHILSDYSERSSRLTKAVDTRLREIKLAIRQQVVETRPKKVSQSKPKRGSKQKSTSKTSKTSGEMAKQEGRPKEKKKPKEEGPELLEAEDRYFEVVEKERQKFAMLFDEKALSQLSAARRRLESRRAETEDETDVETSPSKTSSHKSVRDGKKKRRQRKSPESLPETPRRRIPRAETEVFDQRDSTDLADDETTKGKRYLRKSCRKPCRPSVCCWPTPDLGRRASRRGVHVAASSSRMTDPRKCGMVARGIRARRIMKELRAPPTLLTGEVARARTELRKAAAKLAARHITGRIVERRTRERRPKRPTVEKRAKTTTVKFTEPAMKEEKSKEQERKEEPRDPCTPREPRSITKDFESLLGVPMPEPRMTEKPGANYLEEIEAARKRVYPRISEFHSIEGPTDKKDTR